MVPNMASDTPETLARDRLILTAIGALAGLAAWVLVEILPDFVRNERLMLLIAVFTGGFFAAFLAATGPLNYRRAMVAAGLTAGPAALLLFGASFRFAQVSDFIETGHPIVAYATILVIGLPFLIAAQRPQDGWNSYPALFTQSWNIVVRYAAAWVFVGVVWGVIMLSNALFSLVGLTVIEDLLEVDAVPYVLTGAILGLALAVVVELSDYISPYLVLRLLRLLLPVVFVVTLVFLVALPVQGLNDLFGGLSAAATLLAMAVGIATLITSALDRDDEEATVSRALQFSARALALALPILAGISVYSIWLRVADYGWTPTRLAAMVFALIVLGYGLLYALAVLRGAAWMAHVRRSNIAMALVAVGAAVVWLNPFVSPEQISARTQLARIFTGKVSGEKVDLWSLGRDLGCAGEAALAELAATQDPAFADLRADIARLKASDNRYQFLQPSRVTADRDYAAQIKSAVTIWPEGASVPEDWLDEIAPRVLQTWASSCAQTTPAGHPGCLVLRVDLLPQDPGPEAIFVRLTGVDGAALSLLRRPGTGLRGGELVYVSGTARSLEAEVLDQIRAGAMQLQPVTLPALSFGKTTVIIKP